MPTVMLIHGAWRTPRGWAFFRRWYHDQGYNVVAPPWAHEDVPIEERAESARRRRGEH